ncbi:MAG TPA: T9SS type A sorting domain-containing protein, partial [Chitinophagales bacterium]|nr:T9SS type A sorting domain-containing protein [Chitinophagales bacterium]
MEEGLAYTLPDSSLIIHEEADKANAKNWGAINVYPNPMTDKALITWEKEDPVVGIHVYYPNGSLLTSVEIGEAIQYWQFDRGNLASGLYAYIIIRTNGSQSAGLIVLQ